MTYGFFLLFNAVNGPGIIFWAVSAFTALKQQKKPYVILISADGFRYDLADKYQATNLIKVEKQRSCGILYAILLSFANFSKSL